MHNIRHICNSLPNNCVTHSSKRESDSPARLQSSVLFTTHLLSIPSPGSSSVLPLKQFSMWVWLTMALSRPCKEDRWVLPQATPLTSRRSTVWCPRLKCLKLLNTSNLPRRQLLVMIAWSASLSASKLQNKWTTHHVAFVNQCWLGGFLFCLCVFFCSVFHTSWTVHSIIIFWLCVWVCWGRRVKYKLPTNKLIFQVEHVYSLLTFSVDILILPQASGSHHGQFWHGQGRPLFDVVRPAFPMSIAVSSFPPPLQNTVKDDFGEAVVTRAMPEPC